MSEDSSFDATDDDPGEPVGVFAPWRALLVVVAVAVVLGVIAVAVVGLSSDDKKPAAPSPTTSVTLSVAPTSSTEGATTETPTIEAPTTAAIEPTTVVAPSIAPETPSIAAPAPTEAPLVPTEATLVPTEATTVAATGGSTTKPVPFVGPLSSDPAAVAMVDALTAKAQGRLDDFYALLHPALRAKVPIKTFKKCYAPTSDDRNSIIDVYGLGDADFAHALIPERKAKVVGLRFRLNEQSVERQFFVINSAQDNGWRWVLSAEQVAELADGRCA